MDQQVIEGLLAERNAARKRIEAIDAVLASFDVEIQLTQAGITWKAAPPFEGLDGGRGGLSSSQ